MKNILLVVLLLASIPAFAVNCVSNIVDNANVLRAVKTDPLSGLGADPHVITENAFSGTPDMLVQQYYHSCRDWQSANGGVKPNLVVFVLFPNERKIGVFTGQAWSNAIDSATVRSVMVPYFRGGNYSQGIQVGINQIATAIFAYQHPKQTVVNEQPTDYTGLFTFFDWFLFAVVAFGLVFIGWLIYDHRKKHKLAKDAAQKDAVIARSEAANYVNSHPEDTYAAEKFSRLSNSESMNPDGDWEPDEYRIIGAAYRSLLQSTISGGQFDSGEVSKHTDDFKNYPSQTTTISPTSQTSQTTIINETTPAQTTPVPAFVPIPVYSPVIVEDEPVRRDEDSGSSSDSSPSWKSSWSDSSSSSSFDSSPSSSSWSDSSSSSSFDSGSSFGGGDSGSGGFSGGDSSW